MHYQYAWLTSTYPVKTMMLELLVMGISLFSLVDRLSAWVTSYCIVWYSAWHLLDTCSLSAGPILRLRWLPYVKAERKGDCEGRRQREAGRGKGEGEEKGRGGEEKGWERGRGEKESLFSAYPPMGSYWVSMQKLSSHSQLRLWIRGRGRELPVSLTELQWNWCAADHYFLTP